MMSELESFIGRNRKICWEAEYEDGEFCIGENKVREFLQDVTDTLNEVGENLVQCRLKLKEKETK